MAVTVEHVPFVVLDESYRIVEVGALAEAGFGPLRGRCVWDCFPGSESMYRPHYERARRSDEPSELVQFYGGYLTKVEIRPEGRFVRVAWETLAMLDTSTLERLRASLTAAIGELDRRVARLESPRGRGELLPFLGHVLREHIPDTEPLLDPGFDEARRTGSEVELPVSYRGRAERLRAVPAGDTLAVHVERLAELDVTTLGTLTESLRRIEAELAGPVSERRGPRALSSLRALP